MRALTQPWLWIRFRPERCLTAGADIQSEKPTVAAGREKNEAYRIREYLTEAEIAQLLEAAGKYVMVRLDAP
jgi:hypothetical protein